jgi:enolase
VICLRTLSAREILDSRSRPTLVVDAELTSGQTVRAGVPSGASTGAREAKELRDGDVNRFDGQGVLNAVDHVNGPIADALCGRRFETLQLLDQVLLDLDGTVDKRQLGANAIVGVSMAAARGFAVVGELPLWAFLQRSDARPCLPVPHFNVVNGGAHAPNALEFQEFMLAPLGAPDVAHALRAGAEIYGRLRRALATRGLSAGVGDEGGFAPELQHPRDVLGLLVGAIEDAGYVAGPEGVALALDPASSQFYRQGTYQLAGQSLSSDEMIELYAELTARFPIWLLEDGLAESDWDGWTKLTDRLGDRVCIVGDDLLCTNPTLITEAIERGAANAALIKVNQIGTVTETLLAMDLCRQAGWLSFVSHRSGETNDDFIADLAVGTGCGQMKSGAPARGERVAKYNRLLEIESRAGLRYRSTEH